jgi:hypothetical protein
VAVSTSDLSAIADPFVQTAHVVEMLRQHIVRTRHESASGRRVSSKPVLAPGLRAA